MVPRLVNQEEKRSEEEAAAEWELGGKSVGSEKKDSEGVTSTWEWNQRSLNSYPKAKNAAWFGVWGGNAHPGIPVETKGHGQDLADVKKSG